MSGKRVRGGRSWMDEHVNDPFVQQAKAAGYRSRAAFKLLELDTRDRLLAAGQRVVDLGAAPGSWSQVALKRGGPTAHVVGVDLLPVEPIPGLIFIQGDFSDVKILDAVLAAIGGPDGKQKVDLVLSDMAPNMSGIASADQARAIGLAELALDFANVALKPGGSMVVKLFQGSGYTEFLQALRGQFASVATRKPEASRDRSSEMFVVAKGFKGAAS